MAVVGRTVEGVGGLFRDRPRPTPDIVMFVLMAGLMALGAIMVYSATYVRLEAEYGDPTAGMRRQLVFAGLALGAFIAGSLIDYRNYRRALVPIYVTMIVLLIAVLFFPPHQGASRWIPVGSFQFQPSEFAKVGLVLVLAGFLARDPGPETQVAPPGTGPGPGAVTRVSRLQPAGPRHDACARFHCCRDPVRSRDRHQADSRAPGGRGQRGYGRVPARGPTQLPDATPWRVSSIRPPICRASTGTSTSRRSLSAQDNSSAEVSFKEARRASVSSRPRPPTSSSRRSASSSVSSAGQRSSSCTRCWCGGS